MRLYAASPGTNKHPDRWRLDQLPTYAEERIALAEAALEALVDPIDPVTVTDLLPQPERRTSVGGYISWISRK